MALLSRSSDGVRNPGTAAALTILAGALGLAGCVLMEAWQGGEPSGPAFSHRLHVEDEGLDCTVCHEPGTDSGLPAVRSVELCMLCHDGMDEEKEPDKRAEAFFENGKLRQLHPRLSDEVIFSHTTHAERVADDCTVCHGEIGTSERVPADSAMTMAECMDCHESQGADNSCAACHSEIDLSWTPPSHGRAWDKFHGQAFRARGDQVADQCSVCHDDSTCTQCHQEERPASHTNFWRRRGHGVSAAMDRDNCAVCHRDDFCIRCHDSTRPLTHSGMWGSVRNNHCFNCHFPVKNEGCFVCHKSTPSHREAAPQPPDHTPGANCRLCHGAGVAPLPHVDNGSDCAFCHR